MKYCNHAVTLWIWLLLSPAASAAKPDILQVLLQGSPKEEFTALISLVENAGGSVTHELHIINAVGARLSKTQLKEVLKSPLVVRHIDDLSDTARPDKEPEKESCRVRGHIELDFTPQGIRWPLYNKRPAPATLERLEIAWPPALGTVTAISVGDTTVAPVLYQTPAMGSLKINFPSSRGPVVKERADLKVDFQPPTPNAAGPTLQQRDFSIKATFAGGCSTDLVPGYENNHEDFYYNTVAGVDALHLQGITGKGVTVAVVDSGLWEHDALMKDTQGRNRVVARYDALTDTVGNEVVDESGHGTHMASIVANSDPTTQKGRPTGAFKGVAPDASLVAVKVLDREGLAHVLEIVRGIQWVVDHREKYNIRVLNLSFAQTPRWPYWEDPVAQAAMRAWADGIAVVVSAGNEGPDHGTVGSPGNVPYLITVGAVTDSWTPNTRDDDYLPEFSSRGPTQEGHIKPDIVALGGHMTGLIRPESALAMEQPEDMLRTGEFVLTGTSQASALVSGLLALLLQMEPDLTPNDLKCKLVTSAEPAINRDGKLAYSPFEQGSGLVTATRAVTLGRRECGTPDLEWGADIENKRQFYGPAIVGEDGGPSLPGLKEMVSAQPSENGLSENRKWGVKDHIERQNMQSSDELAPGEFPFGWQELYLLERSTVEALSKGSSTGPILNQDH
jgi:serine protease AprX